MIVSMFDRIAPGSGIAPVEKTLHGEGHRRDHSALPPKAAARRIPIIRRSTGGVMLLRFRSRGFMSDCFYV